VNVESRLHSLTFSVWAFGAAVCIYAAPNAAYVTVVLLAAILVVEVHGRDAPLARSFPLVVGMAAAFGLLRVVLTVLTTHGIDRAVFTFPFDVTMPRFLGGFTLGGTVEESVLLRALAETYPIVVFIAVFAAWSAVVSHAELLRYVPRAFHELGLSVTIAVAFVPTTLHRIRAVGEAELARTGGVRRRGRWLRTALPVLETGLEQAISLSESMDARGYGHREPSPAERRAGWLAFLGVAALGGGLVALVSQADAPAAALVVFGAVTLVVGAATASRAITRTRYRPRRVLPADWVVMAICALAPAVVTAVALGTDVALVWQPARLGRPPLNLAVVAGLTALVAPALFPPRAVPVLVGTDADRPVTHVGDEPVGEAAWAR